MKKYVLLFGVFVLSVGSAKSQSFETIKDEYGYLVKLKRVIPQLKLNDAVNLIRLNASNLKNLKIDNYMG